jgi:hypothetical protein
VHERSSITIPSASQMELLPYNITLSRKAYPPQDHRMFERRRPDDMNKSKSAVVCFVVVVVVVVVVFLLSPSLISLCEL